MDENLKAYLKETVSESFYWCARAAEREEEREEGKRGEPREEKIGNNRGVGCGVESRIGGTPQGRPIDFSPILIDIRRKYKNNGEGCLFKNPTFMEKIRVKLV